jgi:Tfp pilus assembly protein PilO
MALGNFRLKKSEVVLTSLFACAMAYLFQTYWLRPHVDQLNSMKSEVAGVQTQVDQNQSLLVTLKNRVPASIEVKSSNELLDKYIKSNDRFSNVVSSIIQSSNTLSFMLNKISAESQEQLMGYAQTLYSIQAEASFISIGKFLETLEDSPLLTEVQSIEIERTGNELKMCKANIKLFNYVSGTVDPGLKMKGEEAMRKPAGEPTAVKQALEGTVPASVNKAAEALTTPPTEGKK